MNDKKVNLAEPRDLHVDAVLTSYSQKYSHEAFIAEDVLPTAKVMKRSDVYFKYDKDQRFTVPNTILGPKSRAGEIDLKVSTDNYSVEDHGLEEFVSQAEMDNADDPLDPQRDAVDLLMELLLLGHEKRVAELAFAAATYPTGNKVTLTGTNQWTDTTNAKPVTDIMTGLDAAFLRPNVIIFGADSWRTFRTHPQVLDAVKGATRNQGAKGGIASREDVASLFEVEKVIVGRSRHNAAKPGQSASYARLWADNCAMLHLRPTPSPRSVSFGCNFAETLPTVFVRRDDSRGIKGGISVKVVMNESLKVKASDLGYLISDTNA
jgi:hypothetical protein